MCGVRAGSAYKGHVENADNATDVALGNILPTDTTVEFATESSDGDEHFEEDAILFRKYLIS